MSKIQVVVAKCTQGKKGNFVLTLKEEGKKIEVFPGVYKETTGLTYYMSLRTPVAEGSKVPLDLSLFTIKEDPYTVVDKTTGETSEILLKWLWLK